MMESGPPPLLRRARVEYALTGRQLIGTVTIPGQPPRSFRGIDELERCLDAGTGRLVLVNGSGEPSPREAGLDDLSATEREVALRAAQGATNREIADSLFYSVKSVEAYLTRVYRRLGIDGRQGLSALVEATGAGGQGAVVEDLEPPLELAGQVAGGTPVGAGGRSAMATVELLIVG